MHAQWDWMRDPAIQSTSWEWDTACPSDMWRHSHNVVHHTWTNVIGRDPDVGYGVLRVTEAQSWSSKYLLQPLGNLLLMLLFEWGVAVPQPRRDSLRRESKEQVIEELKAIGVKARDQIVKDYVAFPALAALGALVSSRGSAKAGRAAFKSTLKANFAANIVRNVWSTRFIFCRHFPDQTYTFSQEEVAEEVAAAASTCASCWALASTADRCFTLAGNLSFQVEHHLYPDTPLLAVCGSAPRARDICRRYGLPYNTGRCTSSSAPSIALILRLAWAGRCAPSPARTRRPTAPASGRSRSRPTASPAASARRRGRGARTGTRPARRPAPVARRRPAATATGPAARPRRARGMSVGALQRVRPVVGALGHGTVEERREVAAHVGAGVLVVSTTPTCDAGTAAAARRAARLLWQCREHLARGTSGEARAASPAAESRVAPTCATP